MKGVAALLWPLHIALALSHRCFSIVRTRLEIHHSHILMRSYLTANEYETSYSINIHEEQTLLRQLTVQPCVVIYCVHMQWIILSLTYQYYMYYHIACLLTAGALC